MKSKRDLFRGQETSLWNLWRDGVTPSFMRLFNVCREQCRLKYVLGYNGPGSSPMEFGTVCHHVLEHAGFPNFNVEQAVVDYAAKWRKQNPHATDKQLQQQELTYGMVEATMPSYFHRWDGDYNGGKYTYGKPKMVPKTWLAREKEFCVYYTYPDGMKVPIRGKIDALFTNEKGELVVQDLKCRGQINEETTQGTMPTDPQFMAYCWAAQTELKTPVRHMVQNVIRRCQKRQGKKDLQEYLDAVREDVSDPAKWDYLDEVKLERVGYFVRYEMKLGAKHIDDWTKRVLVPQMELIRMWYEGTLPYFTDGDQLIQYQKPCEFYRALVDGDFSELGKRTKVFPELDYEPEVSYGRH